MNTQLVGILVVVCVNVVALAAAWGDMRRQITSNRERNDERHQENQRLMHERHEENQEMLHEIRTDVRRINGSVERHAGILEHHGKEIDRLRGRDVRR